MRRPLLIGTLTAMLLLAGASATAQERENTLLPFSSGAGAPTHRVTVEPGDHLWSISEERLSELDLDQPVGRYWRTVIAANEPNLRSGDPDLIYPGEIVVLPEPSSG